MPIKKNPDGERLGGSSFLKPRNKAFRNILRNARKILRLGKLRRAV